MKQMDFGQPVVQPTEGWIHCTVHVGPNASYLGASRLFLQRKPTLQEFRAEEYQGLSGVPRMEIKGVCRETQAYSRCQFVRWCDYTSGPCYEEPYNGCLVTLLGPEEKVIIFNDYSVGDYKPYFHYPNLEAMESRWRSIGKNDSYIDWLGEGPITAGIGIIGRVDSLAVLPSEHIALYQVCLDNQSIFNQYIESPHPRTRLPFALLVFDKGRLDYVELSVFGKGEPGWLRTICSCPVNFV